MIVDGTDNFPTRYLVNDAALVKRIPVVHGSIFRFEGQATVFYPYKGPCLSLIHIWRDVPSLIGESGQMSRFLGLYRTTRCAQWLTVGGGSRTRGASPDNGYSTGS